MTTMVAKKSKTRKATPRKKKKANKESLLRKLFKWAFVLGIWGGLVLLGIFAWYGKDLHRIAKSVEDSNKRVVKVFANDGSSLLATYGDLRGDNIRIEDLPEHIPNAFIAVEDRRFYSHFGIDLIGLTRAMIANVKAGGIVQGGSGITQQLAKNLFFKPERTLKRKIQEAMLALWIEWKYSKEEILSAYLNHVYFGSGAYGIDAAAYVYFDKSAKDLGLREAALLAGLVQAPSRLSPSHNKDGAIRRMRVVLNDMVETGFITKEMMADAAAIEVVDGKAKGMAFKEQTKDARYFTDWIYRQVRIIAADIKGDLNVTTTLTPRLQQNIAQIVKDTLDREYPEDGDKKRPEAAAVLLNENGAIRAMIGGYNYEISQFNRAVDGRRQAGSAFKPFVYLAAIEQGWRPNDMISNERITSGRYRPSNYDHKYSEQVTLSEALAMSYNVSAVHLIKEVGVRHVVDLADRLGIDAEVREELSTALGTVDLSLLDLTAAYGTIGQDGRQMTPYGILKIETESGDTVYEYAPSDAPRVIAHNHADALTYMMQDVVKYGTGTRANTGFPVAGKTGTTQDYRDALFVGFSSVYSLSVWMGHDDNSSMGRVFGGTIPAAIWRQSMVSAHQGVGAGPITSYDPKTDSGAKSFLNDLFGGNNSGRSLFQFHSNDSHTPTGDKDYSHENNKRYNP
jgi:penicillin-binding protein 1A